MESEVWSEISKPWGKCYLMTVLFPMQYSILCLVELYSL